MDAKIREYEVMWLVADSKKAELEELKSTVDKIVEKAGGTKLGKSIDFERKLAYKIKHNWRGIYVVSHFTIPSKDDSIEGPQNTVAEVTRDLNLHADVLRFIIVSAEDLPTIDEFVQSESKNQEESKTVLKEKGEKIDGKLEKVLKI